MKKVVLLAPTPPPVGGIAGWTARMMQAEFDEGWQVDVVDEKSIGKREVFGKSGKRRILEEIVRTIRIWTDLYNKLKEPETLVVQSCIPAYTLSMMREYVCALITKRHHRKFIVNFRCTVSNAVNTSFQKYILKRLCNQSDQIIALNNKSKDFLVNVTKTPISVIPNFVTANELVENRQVRKEMRRIVYVGGLVENKGIWDMLEVAKQIPDILFVFVGKGDAIFEEEAKKKGIYNIEFAGGKNQNEVKDELLKADAFLFMTKFRGEGFSNSLCEAMAAGLPCIVTDWASNKDMIGTTGGIVVPVGNTTEAVSAIQSIRDQNTRALMSAYNITKVKKEYLEKVVINRLVRLYESICNEKVDY